MIHRLITCQGSAQLVTAIAAINRREAELQSLEMIATCDHLLIYGLAVCENQEAEFVEFIKRMAFLIHPFQTVNTLSDIEITSLSKLHGNNQKMLDEFGLMTGIHSVDEVYVAREWQICNEVILNVFPDAIHICYGDSVGIYLSKPVRYEAYGKFGKLLRILLKMFNLIGRGSDNTSRIDMCYLLLPDAFGSLPCSNVVKTIPNDFFQVYMRLRPLVNERWRVEIRQKLRGQSVWVFMGSNFSEQGLMGIAQEIAAYREWMLSLVPDTSSHILFIKSHPRDDKGKSRLLREVLANDFSEVIFLDDAAGPYIPVEILLLELKEAAERVECLAVSTACLGVGLVLGFPVSVGIGRSLVLQYFPEAKRAVRDRQESELRELCSIKMSMNGYV